MTKNKELKQICRDLEQESLAHQVVINCFTEALNIGLNRSQEDMSLDEFREIIQKHVKAVEAITKGEQ